MGDGDEQAGPFLQGFSVQVYGTVFGYNPLDIGPGGYHAGPGPELPDNLGMPLGAARCQRDDGFAAFRELGAPHEVQLPAGSGIDGRADGVGTHLAAEVYLDGGIDGDHMGVEGYHAGVVGVGDVPHLHRRVPMDEVVHFLRAQQEGGHRLSPVDGFAGVVDNAFLDKLQEINAGIKSHGIVCLVINSEVKECNKDTGEDIEPQFEVNLPTTMIQSYIDNAFEGWSTIKKTVSSQEYDIPRGSVISHLTTNVITFVGQAT